jgi:ribosomal protein S18 acetylase RimI-like enzyme
MHRVASSPANVAKVSIRRARPADAAALTRIAHAAKRHWGYPEKLIRLWRADLSVSPEMIAADPVYCAARDGDIAGFYALSGDGTTREIEHMWVDPRYIGSGIGRQLFAHLLRRLRSMRVARLKIASDPNAEGFYRHMGARRVGRIASPPRGRYLPLLVLRLDARVGPAVEAAKRRKRHKIEKRP